MRDFFQRKWPWCYGYKWSVGRFVGVGVYTCIWRPEVNFRVVPAKTPTLLFLRHSLSLAWNTPSKPSQGSPPVSSTVELTSACHHARICWWCCCCCEGFYRSSSGLCDWKVSAWPTEPSIHLHSPWEQDFQVLPRFESPYLIIEAFGRKITSFVCWI